MTAVRHFVPPPFAGGSAFVAFVLNTLLHFPFLMVAALVRILVPIPAVGRAARRAAAAIGASWIDVNVLGLRVVGDMRWHVTLPPGLRPDGWYLVTSNHQSWVDIVIVQWLFRRKIPMLKFFLKKELFWVPVLGLAWWALEFPFMQRYPRAVLEKRPDLRRRDLETTREACERFRQIPVSVLNFLEGTRFSESKRDRQGSPYLHLLLPRAGGVAQVVSTLGDRLAAWLDVTIHYPGGTPTFWDLISGQIPAVVVHVDVVQVDPAWVGRDYEGDPEYRESLQTFVRELWARKEERLGAMARGPRVAQPVA
jgi:1-acyl-sn-glycerol-3-phosphate acyltransferase